VVEVTPERFEELVADALDGLPPELGGVLENVVVVIAERSRQRGLLGLYEGVPLIARDGGYGAAGDPVAGGLTMPDRITIYRENLCAACADEQELVEQVRITVVHEVAHHFGIDDARLHALGWG